MKSSIQQRNPFRNWHETQQCFGHYALNEWGHETSPSNPHACHWCAMGWLKFMGVDSVTITAFNAFCIQQFAKKSVAELNDLDKWTPRNFEQAWNRFATEHTTEPFTIEL